MKLFITICLLFPLNLYAAEVMHIDNTELKELMLQGVPVIDVRATSEWKETGVIEGSHLMMFYNEQRKYNLEAWLNKLSIIAPKDKPVILICLTGSRSNQLAKYLTKVVGYQEVYNVKRGIYLWKKRDNSTVAPEILNY